MVILEAVSTAIPTAQSEWGSFPDLVTAALSIVAIVLSIRSLYQASQANKIAKIANAKADTSNNIAKDANSLSGAANEISKHANAISEKALGLAQDAAETTEDEAKSARLGAELEKNEQRGFQPYLVVTNHGTADARNIRVRLAQKEADTVQLNFTEQEMADCLAAKCSVKTHFWCGIHASNYIAEIVWEDDSKNSPKKVRTTLSLAPAIW